MNGSSAVSAAGTGRRKADRPCILGCAWRVLFFSIWQRWKERPPEGRYFLRGDYQPGTARKERKKPALRRMRTGDERIPGWDPSCICIAADDHKQAGFQVSLWHFSTQQSACFRLWSSPSAQDSASGARSTFSKDTGMTIREPSPRGSSI